MAKTSKQIGLMLPNDLIDEVEKYMSPKDLCSFLRVGLVEKLNRDFAAGIDPARYSGGRGSRHDMLDASGRARAEAQLANARAARGKKKIKKLRVELGGGGSSGLIPARIDADGELRPLVPASKPRGRSRRKTA